MILLTYEELLILSESESLIVKEAHIPGYGGRLYKNRIAINQALPTQAEKSCVLAEEIGHYCTTTGNILDQNDTMNRKQEYRARLYGYNLRVGLIGIINAYEVVSSTPTKPAAGIFMKWLSIWTCQRIISWK